MMFDLLTMYMICMYMKTVTRRLYNPERRPAIPGGKPHRIKKDRTPYVYGQIKILDCYPQRFGDMTEEDARLEGFGSLREYKEYFYQVNGYITDDELVWVVEFEPIWVNIEGVIL